MDETLTLRESRVACARTLLQICFATGNNHLGSSLSCLDLLVDLHFGRMEREDFCLLSKGHAAPALYSVLAEAGKLPREALEDFARDGGKLPAHTPCRSDWPEVPFGTGSLGHGLALACGMLTARRLQGRGGRGYCVLSDGDCNEGSTWEAALFAAHHRLSSLRVIVDLNGLQALGKTSEILDLEPIEEKWRAFGFRVATAADGNDFRELAAAHAFLDLPDDPRPRCLIARTVKGRGVPFMEGRYEWHYRKLDSSTLAEALRALESDS